MRSLLLWFIPILVISVASDAVFKVKESDDDQTSPAVLNRDKRTGMEIVTIRAAGVVALIAIPVAFLAVTSTIAAVFSVANFVYSVVQGRKQMKELKEIGKKLDEIENLINSRFNEISQELNEIKLISVYGRSIRRLKFFLHQQKIDIRYNSSGALVNKKAATKWAKAVLSYSDDGMRQVLLDFHHMILGESGVFHQRSSVLLLRDRLRDKSGIVLCEALRRYVAYLLCLQTSGHAAKAIAHLVLEQDLTKAEDTLKLLEERLAEQAEFLESHGVLPFYIDGAMTWNDGRTYFFKENNYWRYNDVEGKCDSGYPKLIKEGWGGMQGPIDTVFQGTVKNSPGTYFFKGKSYYEYQKDGQLSDPKPIEDWGGLNGPIGGVFSWRNGATYAFEKDKDFYYRMESGRFSNSYPISKWGGMTGPIDTVFRYKGDIYFFKEWKYYKLEDKGDKRLSVSGPWALDHKWKGLC